MIFEKLVLRVRKGFWLVRSIVFSLCVVFFCEFQEQA